VRNRHGGEIVLVELSGVGPVGGLETTRPEPSAPVFHRGAFLLVAIGISARGGDFELPLLAWGDDVKAFGESGKAVYRSPGITSHASVCNPHEFVTLPDVAV